MKLYVGFKKGLKEYAVRYVPSCVTSMGDEMVSLIEQHCLSQHLYADDTQIYGAYVPSDGQGALLQKITGCLTAVADWMSANRLQLNPDKTEFMWLTSPRSQHRLPTSGPLIGSTVVSPSATVSAFSSIKI